MMKRLIVPRLFAVLLVGGLVAGGIYAATLAWAAPDQPGAIQTRYVAHETGGKPGFLAGLGGLSTEAPGAPPEGARFGVVGKVTSVNGSTYTLGGKDGHSITIQGTDATTYANADGSAADASAVKAGTTIEAQGTSSDDGNTLNAARITVGISGEGSGLRMSGGPGPVDGAFAVASARVSSVNGSTYTMDGPKDHALTIEAKGNTAYVNADGSSTDASAVKAGSFITAEGTVSDDGQTLTATRITVGSAPQEGVRVSIFKGQASAR